MKTISIIQPRGLGDILFSQKIAKKLIENDFIVNWYTNAYFWVKDYIIHPNLNFTSDEIKSDYKLLLCNSIEHNHPYDIMTSKYSMIGNSLRDLPENLHHIDYSDWVDYFSFERNFEKENDLYYNTLGLNDDTEYILYNSKFGISQINKNVENSVQNIEIKKIDLGVLPKFTLFDWSKVIENAKEIHTVDTSVIYLVEKLTSKHNKLYMYPRHPEHTKKCLENILKKDWIWM